MGRPDLGSRAFRAGLKVELARWQAEGIVDEPTAGALRQRYRLDETQTAASVLAIYVLGALLVGGGVISLVAWNWDALSRLGKLVIIVPPMIAAHLGGYWLWRIDGRRLGLGHALVFLGTVLFGANVGLVAQIFHVERAGNETAGAWALGALAAAWIVGSAPTAALALVLGVVWYDDFVYVHERLRPFLMYWPALLVLPLALRLESRALVTASVTALLVCAFMGILSGDEVYFAVLLALSALLAATRFAVAGSASVQRLTRDAGRLGLLGCAVLLWLLSFQDLATEVELVGTVRKAPLWSLAALVPLLAAAAGVLRAVQRPELRRARPLTFTLVVAALACVVALFVPTRHMLHLSVLANLGLAVSVVQALVVSTRELQRGPFWYGSLMGALLIVARFFEYDTGFGTKAVVLITCGLAVILLGLRFERRLKATSTGASA